MERIELSNLLLVYVEVGVLVPPITTHGKGGNLVGIMFLVGDECIITHSQSIITCQMIQKHKHQTNDMNSLLNLLFSSTDQTRDYDKNNKLPSYYINFYH
jgi:hypothetical protein